MIATRYQQRGITLVVGLVILVLMTLLAVTSFNMGKNDLNIVGNMQQRNQAMDAARAVLQTTISSTAFMDTPNSSIIGTCSGANVTNADCFDVNGDGQDDIKVAINPAPTCVMAQVILNSSLDMSNPDDLGCAVGVSNQSGIVGGSSSGASLCANTVWEVNAVATDLSSGAESTVSSGAAARTSTDNVSAACP
jgi:Tfp pilus assembly protein PilX